MERVIGGCIYAVQVGYCDALFCSLSFCLFTLIMRIILFVGFLSGMFTGAAFSQAVINDIDVQFQQAPWPVTIDGLSVAYYELRVTNVSSDTVRLLKVTVLDSKMLLVSEGEELKGRTSAITLAPRAVAIVYLEVSVKGGQRLLHSVDYVSLHAGKEISHVYNHSAVDVTNSAPPVLGSPLGDGTWAAIYEPVWARGHRRVVFTIDGVDYLPGRFAIDFMRLDSAGHYASGNENVIANWYGYGNPVLAVADGVVVGTRTDFVESPTLSGHPKYTSVDATGNYVAIDIGHDQVVFCEHLKPGSIRVAPGQKVSKGDVIGAVGFTGQSTGPHLHLHVANRNAPLGAEGIPFVFESFRLLGRYPDFGVFGKGPWEGITGAVGVVKERPGKNVVIGFGK